MTHEEVIARLKDPAINRAQVARETGLNYMWLYDVKRGHIKDPGSAKFERLRNYFEQQQNQ